MTGGHLIFILTQTISGITQMRCLDITAASNCWENSGDTWLVGFECDETECWFHRGKTTDGWRHGQHLYRFDNSGHDVEISTTTMYWFLSPNIESIFSEIPNLVSNVNPVSSCSTPHPTVFSARNEKNPFGKTTATNQIYFHYLLYHFR